MNIFCVYHGTTQVLLILQVSLVALLVMSTILQEETSTVYLSSVDTDMKVMSVVSCTFSVFTTTITSAQSLQTHRADLKNGFTK